MQALIRTAAAFLLLATSACTASDAPYDVAPGEVVFADSFAGGVSRLSAATPGQLWIARWERSGPGAATHSWLERRTRDGIELSSYSGEFSVADITVHPSGALTAALMVPVADSEFRTFALDLARLSAQGELVWRSSYTDFSPPPEECAFSDFLHSGAAALTAVGEFATAAIHRCGKTELIQLSDVGDLRWLVDASPTLDSVYEWPAIAADHRGHIAVSLNLDPDHIAAYEEFAGQPLDRYGDSDGLIARFSATGELQRARVVGTPRSNVLHGLSVHETGLCFAGSADREIAGGENDSHEGDLLVGCLDPQLNPLWQRQIDIDNEDYAEAIAHLSGDRIAVGGVTGFRQVDTHSVVTHGQAFVLELDSDDGNKRQLTRFGGARHDVVTDIAVAGGSPMVCGVRDAPITHDGDHDSSQLYSRGYFRPLR